MSTKIYTGFIVRAASTQHAIALLGTTRQAIQALVDKKHRQAFVRRLVDEIDGYTLRRHLGQALPEHYQKSEDNGAWWTVADALREEQQACRVSMQREPLVDCDVELFLRMHPVTGELLGYLQEERVGVYPYLIGVPGIAEFGYWNNSDAPDGMSEEDWDARGALWDAVLDDDTVACLTLKWQPGFLERADITGELPSFESRVSARARNAVIHRYVQAHDTTPPGSASLSGVMRCMREAETALNDPQSALSAELALSIATFTPYLLADLAPHLFHKLKDLPGLPPQAS